MLCTPHEGPRHFIDPLLGDLHSFGSPLNLTGKNLIPVTSSLSCSGGKKKSRLGLGKFSQQSSTEVHSFLLVLTACGLVLLYSRSWCKIWEIKIWAKAPSLTLSLQGDRECGFHWQFLSYPATSLVSSTLSYKVHSRR